MYIGRPPAASRAGVETAGFGLPYAAEWINHERGPCVGEACLVKPFVAKDGYIDLPTGPGLGIEPDEDALAGKINHDRPNPRT